MNRRLLVVAAIVFGAGCGDSGPPSAPRTVRPPPPPFSAHFAEDDLRVTEGETAPVLIRYRINDLTDGVRLGIRLQEETATEDDYEISADFVELPPGRGVSGEASLSLGAARDGSFAEGEEVLSLGFVRPEAAAARRGALGQDLRVTIAEAGVEPCPGIRVRATPPEWLDEPDRWITSTLELEWPADAGETGFDFLGPYSSPFGRDQEDRNALFRVHLVAWTVRETTGGVRHSVALEWPSWVEDLGLRFPASEVCGGEAAVACSIEGCEARPAT